MQKLPEEIINCPLPLVFIAGSLESKKDPEIDNKITSCLTELCSSDSSSSSSSFPSIRMKRVPLEHAYYPKAIAKENKEQHNTDGILKSDWLPKHYNLLPSVVVMLTPFNIAWNTQDWIRHEANLQDAYQKLKFNLYTRDVKVIVVVVKQQAVHSGSNSTPAGTVDNALLPVGAPLSQDKDVLEERLSSMKRRLQVDSKYFIFMQPSDFVPTSLVCKKLARLVRDCSMSYYVVNSKRLKVLAKSTSGGNTKVSHGSLVLLARFFFKVAYYFEFLNQHMSHSLKYYRTAFNALGHLVDSTAQMSVTSRSSVTSQSNFELMEQAKMLSGWINYKINYILFSIATSAIPSAPVSNLGAMFSPNPLNSALTSGVNNTPPPPGAPANTPIPAGAAISPLPGQAAPPDSPQSPGGRKNSGGKGKGKPVLVGYIAEACLQFRNHVAKFGAVRNIVGVYGVGGGLRSSLSGGSAGSTEEFDGPAPLFYRHYAWMVDQYLCFVQFFELFGISPTQSIDTDRTNYYVNAYKYTKLRHENYLVCLAAEKRLQKGLAGGDQSGVADPEAFLARYKGFMALPRKYVGEALCVVEPSVSPLGTGAGPNNGVSAPERRMYALAQEREVTHMALQLQYLSVAMSYVPPARKRYAALLATQYADLCMLNQQEGIMPAAITAAPAAVVETESAPAAVTVGYHTALRMYLVALDSYSSEDWLHVAIPLLQKAFLCAKYVGNLSDCLQLGLKLLSYSETLMKQFDAGVKAEGSGISQLAVGSRLSTRLSDLDRSKLQKQQQQLQAQLDAEKRGRNPLYPSEIAYGPASDEGALIESCFGTEAQRQGITRAVSSIMYESFDTTTELLLGHKHTLRLPAVGPVGSGSTTVPFVLQSDYMKCVDEGDQAAPADAQADPSAVSVVAEQPPIAHTCLPDGYTVDFCGDSNCFATQVWFLQRHVELANYARVNVHITSLLPCTITPTELYIHFSSSIIIQRFVHDDSVLEPGVHIPDGEDALATAMSYYAPNPSKSSTITKPIRAKLVFECNKPTILSTLVYFPEESLSQSHVADAYVCIDLIKMVIRVPRLSAFPEVEVTEAGARGAVGDDVVPATASLPSSVAFTTAAKSLEDVATAVEDDDVRASFVNQRESFVQHEVAQFQVARQRTNSRTAGELAGRQRAGSSNAVPPAGPLAKTAPSPEKIIGGSHYNYADAGKTGDPAGTAPEENPVEGEDEGCDVCPEEEELELQEEEVPGQAPEEEAAVVEQESSSASPQQVPEANAVEVLESSADAVAKPEAGAEDRDGASPVPPVSGAGESKGVGGADSPCVPTSSLSADEEEELLEQQRLRESIDRALQLGASETGVVTPPPDSPIHHHHELGQEVGSPGSGGVSVAAIIDGTAAFLNPSATAPSLTDLPPPPARARMTSFALTNPSAGPPAVSNASASPASVSLGSNASVTSRDSISTEPTTGNKDYRRLIFDISCFSTAYISDRLNATKGNITVRDMCKFSGGPFYDGDHYYGYNTTSRSSLSNGPEWGLYVHSNNNMRETTRVPPLLHLVRPHSSLKLLSPVTAAAPGTTAKTAASAVTEKSPITTVANTLTPCAAQSAVVLLQGVVQRLNVVVGSDVDHIRRGKCFISSDYHGPGSGTVAPGTKAPGKPASLFWYPDFSKTSLAALEKAQRGGGAHSDGVLEEMLDGVGFNPLLLSPNTNQPFSHYLLPNAAPGAPISVPLFLQAEQTGSFTIKLKFEYLPNARATIPVTSEHEIRFSVQKAATMSFSICSGREALCGILPLPSLQSGSGSASTNAGAGAAGAPAQVMNPIATVLRGDDVQLCTTLTCLAAPTQGVGTVPPTSTVVEVLDMRLVMAAAGTGGEGSEQDLPSLFELRGADGMASSQGASLLDFYGKEEKPPCSVSLQQHENILSVSDVHCSESGGGFTDEATVVSVGSIHTQWRLRDYSLFTDNTALPQFSGVQNFAVGGDAWAPTDRYHAPVAPAGGSDPFSWLLPLAALPTAAASGTPVDATVSINRKCKMVFSVPPVQVVTAPFQVDVECPANGLRVGELLPLHIHIRNRYSQTTERLSLKVELHELFLVTGSNSAVFEICPHQEHVVSFGLVPLDSGYIPLPHVSLQWLSGAHGSEEFAAGARPRDRTGSSSSSTLSSSSVSVASTGKVLLDLSSQSSPRCVFVLPGACAADAAARANGEAVAGGAVPVR